MTMTISGLPVSGKCPQYSDALGNVNRSSINITSQVSKITGSNNVSVTKGCTEHCIYPTTKNQVSKTVLSFLTVADRLNNVLATAGSLCIYSSSFQGGQSCTASKNY